MMCNAKVKPVSFMDSWNEFQKTRNVEIRNEAIAQYSYIVKCIAIKVIGHYQFFNYSEDIVNEGLIALLDAFEKFDPDKNVKFETYASIKVRGAIIDYIRKQDCFPRRLKHIAKNISEAEEKLSNQLGRSPTEQEMADHLKVSLPEFEKMETETCSLNMLSFEEMVYEKGMEAQPLNSGNEAMRGPEQVVAEKEMQDVLADSIELLNEKERLVISLYYKDQLKIKEISSVMGIGASRVSQIHSSALRKLKIKLNEYFNQ